MKDRNSNKKYKYKHLNLGLNRLYFKGMYYEMLMFVRLTTVDNKLASQENCIKFMDNLRDFTK